MSCVKAKKIRNIFDISNLGKNVCEYYCTDEYETQRTRNPYAANYPVWGVRCHGQHMLLLFAFIRSDWKGGFTQYFATMGDSRSVTITRKDIITLEARCLEQIREDVLYAVRNDAKLRAVLTSKNYDDFKNIVDAAHLTPLSTSDKRNAKTKNRIWNNSTMRD
ncbi:uncharacterized protein LOC121592451 [Anopheles merus]|uniref:uncharacterized protein LOC121592451 n=1 Tax=Anopheles merus TaxID=30066 RepID=UPI001BE43953|nr:uncharacterized protein LOC121592451 [Anopheles merus]